MQTFSVIFLGAVSILAAGAMPAQQLRGSLELGSSSVRYADSINVTAASVNPGFQLALPQASLGGTGTLSQASGSSTYSGSFFGALSTVPRRFSGELGGNAGGSAHSDGSRTSQMLGTGRVYLNGNRGGGWAGAGLGRTWDGVLWRGVMQGSVGGWLAGDAGSAVAELSPATVDDTIAYTDATLSLQSNLGRLELQGTLGSRFGDPVPTLVTDRMWGSLSATAWVRPGIGIMASGGTYPIDFTQGYPGGRFVSLALRLAFTRSGAAMAPVVMQASADLLAFEAQQVAGGTRIRVHAPAARSVEVTGSFSSWRPVRLTSAGNGWWAITQSVPSGTHEINVRVDGGSWRVPPGLTPLRDEFGGSAGLLVVP